MAQLLVYFLYVFQSGKRGQINYAFENGDSSIENFEYDYIETERLLTIINSQLDGQYEVTLTSTTLRLN